MSRPEDILSFWFGQIDPEKAVPPDRGKLWFGGAKETDDILREKFLVDIRCAAAGDYDFWSDSARETLALILLLDQFPRNIFRNTPEAFATDAKALSFSLAGIDSGFDRQLTVVERAFFYLPMEHSEELAMQQKSVAAFRELIDDASPAQKQICESYYDYAVRHYDIIVRFGRFPHRNKILGRTSTAEEFEFLQQPGSSF